MGINDATIGMGDIIIGLTNTALDISYVTTGVGNTINGLGEEKYYSEYYPGDITYSLDEKIYYLGDAKYGFTIHKISFTSISSIYFVLFCFVLFGFLVFLCLFISTHFQSVLLKSLSDSYAFCCVSFFLFLAGFPFVSF